MSEDLCPICGEQLDGQGDALYCSQCEEAWYPEELDDIDEEDYFDDQGEQFPDGEEFADWLNSKRDGAA